MCWVVVVIVGRAEVAAAAADDVLVAGRTATGEADDVCATGRAATTGCAVDDDVIAVVPAAAVGIMTVSVGRPVSLVGLNYV